MRKGVTFIELIITMSIIVIISLFAVPNLFGTRQKDDLDSATKQIGALLRQAQSDAMSQEQGTAWGVHFENSTSTPFFSLFSSSTYASSVIVGYYRLPASVAYSTSTLAVGSSTNVVFFQITGAASASTTIRLYLTGIPSLSSTISVASSGTVNY